MLLDGMTDKFPELAAELAARPFTPRTCQRVSHRELDPGTRVMVFPRTPVLGEALRGWEDQKTIVHVMGMLSFRDVQAAARQAARALAPAPQRPAAPVPQRPAQGKVPSFTPREQEPDSAFWGEEQPSRRRWLRRRDHSGAEG